MLYICETYLFKVKNTRTFKMAHLHLHSFAGFCLCIGWAKLEVSNFHFICKWISLMCALLHLVLMFAERSSIWMGQAVGGILNNRNTNFNAHEFKMQNFTNRLLKHKYNESRKVANGICRTESY